MREDGTSQTPATAVETVAPPASGTRGIRRGLRLLGRAAWGFIVLAVTAWGALAVCYAGLSQRPPRYGMALAFAIASLAAAMFFRPRQFRPVAFGAMFLLALAWFFTRTPANDREWADAVSRLTRGEVQGDRLILHDVRNFDYRSATDYTPGWVDRTYDLSRLTAVDFILVHWGSDAIAHAIVAFEFDDGQYLDVSIEARKERHESYSALQGFFRQFELIYVFAEERDVLRLRSNLLDEHVYLFRTRMTPAHARSVLLSYVARANELRERPEFYNALTTNCATGVLPHAKAGGARGQYSYEILLSGYAARQAYRNGALDDSIPYEELRRRSFVNPVAQALDQDPDFSRKIRAGLPTPSRRPS